MTPAGQNYPIAEHSVVFWVIYLAGAITMTFVLMGLFLVMVGRASNATRADVPAPSEPSPELPTARPTDELHPAPAA